MPFLPPNQQRQKLKIKTNLLTEIEISISTYLNADVECYSATCRTELNERNSIPQIVDRS